MWRKTYEARLAEMRRLQAEADAALMSTLGEGYVEGALEDPWS